MKIAILGYGKMGQLIEKVAIQSGNEIVVIIDNNNDWNEKIVDFRNADIAIDFSMPSVATDNILRSFANNIPIVIGTTGWFDKLNDIEKECSQVSGKLLYGANFSIGANIFFKLNSYLAKIMSNHDVYHASICEIHHIHKKDAPSGTAIHLAQDIISKNSRLSSWSLADGPINEHTLPITAIREAEVPGTHEILWSSDVDRIELKHTAYSRMGFAQGAVLGARWLLGKPSGIYEFSQVFDSMQ